MGYLQKGGDSFFSLVMSGFCSNEALYSGSTSFAMFIGPTAVALLVLQNMVSPSFTLSRCFVGIGLVFCKFWHGARKTLEKLILLQTQRKWVKMGQKYRFLNILKRLAFNFYLICSIMETYICCISVHNLFGKNLVPEI